MNAFADTILVGLTLWLGLTQPSLGNSQTEKIAGPEQRQAKGNVSKFTMLSIATQRSWKDADDKWAFRTEWHRVVVIWNYTC